MHEKEVKNAMLCTMLNIAKAYQSVKMIRMPYFILVMITIVTGVASVYFIGAMTIKYNKIYTAGEQTNDIDTFLVTKLPASDSLKKSYNDEYRFAKIMAIVCIICTMILCLFCANAKMIANRYGAYSDFNMMMNITSIPALSQYNFEDNSDDYISSSQTEKIVILFKYDDKNTGINKTIKTNILSIIDETGIDDIYFMSASSDAGKNIIRNNEDIELPAVMLISNDEIIHKESLSNTNTISENMNRIIKIKEEMISQ